MLQRRQSANSHDLPCIPFTHCPAKTYQRVDGTVQLGRSVVEHCQIVGEVAQALIRRYPELLRAHLFPLDAPFAAACHDIGKVSPCFVEKLCRACTSGYCQLPTLNVNPELERQWGGHAGVSQAAAKAMNAPQWVPEILGQHHGFSPELGGKRADAQVFGGPEWQQQREALLVELEKRLGMSWPQVTSIAQARVLAGLTSVADWIGSGRHFEDPALPWAENIERAIGEAGFIPPTYRLGLSFEQVFGFAPRAAQQQLIAAARMPGVYVLEAPMGLGKTEAALYAAYRVLETGQACGIYFALPTQLTSNKIYQRFNTFLQSILSDDCAHNALLLHGNAWLLEGEMGEEGRPGGAWFNHAKRGLLAPFAVGTIDQALMAAMNVKHGFVRAFGLAGKVVILDEAHTYDAYTGTLLDALVALLQQLGCTVIILSATLNQERRQQLLGTQTLSSQGYPLISAVPHAQAPCEYPLEGDAPQRVELRLLEQEQEAIAQALERASQGQQVLWIENTVVEAQERYLDLASRASELGLACGLLHSRFNVVDRQKIEDHWINLFGKEGWPKRGEQGRILIGTQVLEQSLDIDADFLVSRFAPNDMLLQRLGRLWRHTGTPRPATARREAWLLAPQLETAIATPQAAFGSSAHVYSPYVLCRSLEVWQGKDAIELPTDIRPLIEQTYASRDESGDMARWLHELDNGTSRRKGRKALRQLARVGLAEDGKTLPESQAQTRYSETDSHEVLLLRALRFVPEQQASRVVLLDGRVLMLPKSRHALSKKEWKQLTAILMQQIVPVRASDAPRAPSLHVLRNHFLHHCFYLGDPNWTDDESLLRVALVSDTSTLLGLQGERVHDRHTLEYRDDLGYRVIKQ
ncbi:MAG TPA: CRISPR-associated helicase Cas3' [Nitrosomonas europaea]|uniref:CRISPR-associated helicase Cas3' n=1 Tax=Nitrosomonas europaea TaxID=915 RepID=UPI0024924F7B|nr:CRISPR-associated helicase Cas3' [Nitrosomonas europaea]HRN82720.1 CRISPR-associated helicase Cas3' [Nitrosomonas europaea]HRO55259.1 CRISPR-associated helicase Cas3' [Nitrosomonas europaea]HUM73031.1 CRISPR-associated helicase Cas3' [Nitrosomonas europaea]